jgi:ATP-binding cassette subfamily B protein
MMKKWDERQEAFSALSDFAQENFSGIAVIKAFVKEFRELWAFKKLNKNNEDANIAFTKISVLLHIFVTLFVESVICVILGYGGHLVYIDKFNAAQLIEFISYFSSVVWPIMAISQLIDMSSRGKASLKRVSELLDAEINVKDGENVRDIDYIKGDIEFRNLTFRYPDADYDSLEGVSFKINAGENVGVIGKTGSGKTTVVDLILRTYNVPDGTVFIDGHDVNTIPIKTVRKYSAYVPQDNFLFSDTIENNIAFATDGGSLDDVIRAAKLSDVHTNISEFAEQYATVLGERGVTVSGGQKQRISIARALMKDANILILDDSVSAVDTETERVIISNLRENRRGKTTILIAHRISTVEKMDKIIFIEDGKVIAVGSHDELTATCPAYATMVELQKLEEEKEGV